MTMTLEVTAYSIHKTTTPNGLEYTLTNPIISVLAGGLSEGVERIEEELGKQGRGGYLSRWVADGRLVQSQIL